MKFCKDCIYFEEFSELLKSECRNAQYKSESYLIDGKTFNKTCIVARSKYEPCGPAGILWQERVTKPARLGKDFLEAGGMCDGLGKDYIN